MDLNSGNDIVSQYVHTSYTNHKVLSSFTDFIAHYREIGGERVIYRNDPENAIVASDPSTYNNTYKHLIPSPLSLFNNYANSLIALEKDGVKYLYNKAKDLLNKAIGLIFGDDSKGLEIKDNQFITIQKANSLQAIADKFQITKEELLAKNPWLKEQGRISSNGKYVLIKPNEKIFLPENAVGEGLAHKDGRYYTFNSSDFGRRVDPLTLDTNKDGIINTTTVQESETYFDLTGDGIKERVGWIKAEDALLVYDKNEDGKVSGIDEVFGNESTEGFDELRAKIDSNYDNKIDRRDVLFNRLQIWHDKNQDGQAQEGELTYLKDAGINDIDLNSVNTNIQTNGHTITQASRYTNTQGEKGLIADIHLAYDSRITTIDPTLIKDFSIDVTTLSLPNLRGYGLVTDSFISYNTRATCRFQKITHNLS